MRSRIAPDKPRDVSLLLSTAFNLSIMATNPLAGPSALKDIVHPQFHQNNFPEELYVKNELGLKLDKGKFLRFLIPSLPLTGSFKTIKYVVCP